MFILMGISLYTSRIVLTALGAEDYGIYNIVGSVIVLFSFINNALTNSTRRFINFSLGKDDGNDARHIFSVSFTIHLIISLLIFFIGETIGLWFLKTYLNIPEARESAAFWVYQFSIGSTCIGIIGAPFEAAIVAYEKMSIYAYLSIFEGILKLIIVYFLVLVNIDKLIFYSFLILVVCLIINISKWIYCKISIPITSIKLQYDTLLFKKIGSFSGWSLFGQIAYVGGTTGLNMLINMFFGVLLNAAIGIAQQINTAIYNFVSSFQTAFNPQLIQTYSSGKLEEHRLLLSRASRISFYLLLIISIPLILNIDYILQIWLNDVPEHTAIFTKLIIACSLIEALGSPLWMSMSAIGNIRNYQIIVSSINFSTIFIAYIALKFGAIPEIIFVIKMNIGIALYIFRIFYILPKLNYRIKLYCKEVVFPCSVISATISLLIYFICIPIDDNLFRLLISIICTIFFATILIYAFGINDQEKTIINNYFKKWMH